MSREKNKENNKEGNKRKVKQKKKQDQENQGATAGMTAANECSDKTLQKRQRDNTQREILRLHDLNRDPEGLNNEPIMEQSSSTYGISEGVNDFIPAGRKRDNGHVVPMPATAEMSSVLTRLSMMEGKMERHEERISGVEERFNDAFKDNTTQLKEVFKILAEMKADRPSPRSPLRQSPQQQAPLRQSPLRQSPLRQSPQRQSPQWQSPQRQSPQRQSPQWQSPQQQSPQQQSLQQQSPQQQSILQQQSPQQQSLLQQQTPLQQPETTTGLIPPAALKAALEEVDARKATKALLLCMFGKEVLATHSFRASATKPALDQTKTSAIINTVIHNFPQCKTYGLKNTRTKEAAIARFIGDTCQDKHRLKDRLLAKLRPSHPVPPPTSLSFPLTSASASPSSNGVLSSAVSSAMISYM
ncbi:uncharacterized protein [Amphiura filiformis]|uniref:uncharacterized protein n=1 Tax=Amphiura filiformis TaxID=82378 RepID=UPI003B225B37